MTHVLHVVHGISASLALGACWYLAGLIIVPRRWASSLGHAMFPVFGAALFVVVCWVAISAQRIPLGLVIPGFGGVLFAMSILRIRTVVAVAKDTITSRALRNGLLLFMGFYVLVYLMTWPPASDIFLPPAWSGDVDLLSYTRYAKHLLIFGSPELEGMRLDYFQSPAVSYLLAAFAFLYEHEPMSAAMPALFGLVAATSVAAVVGMRSIFRLPTLAAVVIAIIVVTSAYFQHIVAEYQLPIVASLLILLILLWTIVRARADRVMSDPMVAAVVSCNVLLFFTDMLALGIALGLQVLTIVLLMRSGVKAGRFLVYSPAATVIVLALFADRLRWSIGNLSSSIVAPTALLTSAIGVLASSVYFLRREDIIGRFAKSPADRRLTIAAIGYGAIAIIAGNVAVHAAREPALIRMPGKWRNIEQLKNRPFKELTLKIDHDPGGLLRAVTRYFLPEKKVHVIGPRTRVRDLPFATVSRQSPILIQNFGCEGAGHSDVVTIGGVGCAIFAPPAFELDTLYPFNRTFLFVTVDGMTEREARGKWNIGRRMRLKLMADPERTRINRNLYVNISLNPSLAAGAPPARLGFTWGANRTGETAIAKEDWISVPISTGDWTGNRVWVLPLSIDFFDGRTMLFHHLSVSETPRGRLVQ